MAGIKELDVVSSTIMCMDTLAMDSMDMHLGAYRTVEAPPVLTDAQAKERISIDSGPAERAQQMKDDVHELEDLIGSGAQEFDSDDEKETCYDDDEGLMTDPGTPDTPGTPQVELAQDVDELDEVKDMNLETENDLEEEQASDDEVLDSDPGTPQREAPEDVNKLDETKEMNVDETETDLEVLGEGEKSLDSENFVAPFPITRVKRIIKLDKDVKIVSSDAIALITQATALFLQDLSSASFTVMLQTKRKTIRGPDVVLAAKSTRQFRECLDNELETLLKEPDEGIMNDEDGLVEKEHGTGGEPVRKKSQQQKSAKKHQLAPPGSRPITSFFKA